MGHDCLLFPVPVEIRCAAPLEPRIPDALANFMLRPYLFSSIQSPSLCFTSLILTRNQPALPSEVGVPSSSIYFWWPWCLRVRLLVDFRQNSVWPSTESVLDLFDNHSPRKLLSWTLLLEEWLLHAQLWKVKCTERVLAVSCTRRH